MNEIINKSLALEIQNISKDGFDFSRKKATKSFEIGDYESAVDWIYFAATLAWGTNPGFFYDKELEDVLDKIGQKVGNQNKPFVELSELSNDSSKQKKILHILSTAYLTGGHTRLVAHWIDNCRIHCQNQVHSILITSQGKSKVPDWLTSSAKNIGGECIVFPDNLTWLQKAYSLRSITKEWSDIIVMHIHPNDPVPNIAFSSADWDIPVLFCNHADHVFSLGMSISDIILDIRKSGQRITNNRRKYGNRSMLLPIPLIDRIPHIDQRENLRIEARKNLNLPLYEKIALTIGSEYKYKPSLGYNFFECIKKILLKDNTIHVYAIGLPNSGSWKALSEEMKGRFHPVGLVQDKTELEDYYLAADVYIEGFPMGSLTAMLDAGLYMLPIQRINNPFAPILSGDDIGLDQLISIANDEDEYINGAIKLLHTSSDIRNNIGKKTRDSILTNHCGKAWVDNWLNPIIEQVSLNNYKDENMMLTNNQDDSRSIENLSLSLSQWEHRSPILIPLDAWWRCSLLQKKMRIKILLYALTMLHFNVKRNH